MEEIRGSFTSGQDAIDGIREEFPLGKDAVEGNKIMRRRLMSEYIVAKIDPSELLFQIVDVGEYPSLQGDVSELIHSGITNIRDRFMESPLLSSDRIMDGEVLLCVGSRTIYLVSSYLIKNSLGSSAHPRYFVTYGKLHTSGRTFPNIEWSSSGDNGWKDTNGSEDGFATVGTIQKDWIADGDVYRLRPTGPKTLNYSRGGF